MQKILTAALAFSLLLVACKKTDAPEGTSETVFMTNIFQGSNLEWTAGLEDIYLFTRFEQHTQDSTFSSISSFTNVNCPAGDCPKSLTFELLMYEGSTFFPGSFEYILPDSTNADTLNFITFSGNGSAFYPNQTLFYNGTKKTFDNPEWAFTEQFQDISVNVELEATAVNGIQSKVYQALRFDYPELYPSVFINAVSEGNMYRLKAVSYSPFFANFMWNNQSSQSEILVDSLSSSEVYSVTVTNVYGVTASASLANLPFPIDTMVTYQNAIPGIEIKHIYVPTSLPAAKIRLVDENGVEWCSDRLVQPYWAQFTISEVADYQNNENGDTVKKMKVGYFCLLRNSGGEDKEFQGEAVVGFAKPK